MRSPLETVPLAYLRLREEKRKIVSNPVHYLAVPIGVYEAFFKREFAQISVERYQIKLALHNINLGRV
ncbi:MAG TPA: hypothetical protein DCL61_07770 [Cyanobacteria bacterium UBA12227]|nr:hypothetical protein [Cyanobacteria bacterium UBA12227]HAX87882.1 hypothetical protein [Cyanobacteria bacterium UBA11370]HBY79666.1 hypothetical protein [Cyanobacteria bacterium UBA11148]